jgi:hypothetical protein
MCLICQSLDDESMTPWEARKAAFEIAEQLSLEHVLELVKKLEEIEDAIHSSSSKN